MLTTAGTTLDLTKVACGAVVDAERVTKLVRLRAVLSLVLQRRGALLGAKARAVLVALWTTSR